jgi:hypothetical protein
MEVDVFPSEKSTGTGYTATVERSAGTAKDGTVALFE